MIIKKSKHTLVPEDKDLDKLIKINLEFIELYPDCYGFICSECPIFNKSTNRCMLNEVSERIANIIGLLKIGEYYD